MSSKLPHHPTQSSDSADHSLQHRHKYHRRRHRQHTAGHAAHAAHTVAAKPGFPDLSSYKDESWQATPIGRATHLGSRLVHECHMSTAQAVAFVGNVMHESQGLSPNINEKIGPRGEIKFGAPMGKGGFGYAQWTGIRQYAFVDWCKTNKLNPQSIEANEGYVVHELNTKFDGQIAQTNKLRDFSQIMQKVTDWYENPGIIAMDHRQKLASNFAQHMWPKTYLAVVGPSDSPIKPKGPLTAPEIEVASGATGSVSPSSLKAQQAALAGAPLPAQTGKSAAIDAKDYAAVPNVSATPPLAAQTPDARATQSTTTPIGIKTSNISPTVRSAIPTA